jgi:hypothetical protein
MKNTDYVYTYNIEVSGIQVDSSKNQWIYDEPLIDTFRMLSSRSWSTQGFFLLFLALQQS